MTSSGFVTVILVLLAWAPHVEQGYVAPDRTLHTRKPETPSSTRMSSLCGSFFRWVGLGHAGLRFQPRLQSRTPLPRPGSLDTARQMPALAPLPQRQLVFHPWRHRLVDYIAIPTMESN